MTESPPTPAAPGARGGAPKSALSRYWWVAGLAVAGVIAVLAALFASGDPDGLYRVAADKGFEEAAQDPGFGVLPGYSIPGLDGTTSTIVAGVVGIVVIFLLVLLLGRLLARRRKDTAA
jgi:cobalt/nickel transport system permease protein